MTPLDALDEEHQGFAGFALGAPADGSAAATTDVLDVVGGLLDGVGGVVAAVQDQHVLLASGDVQLALVEEAQIAGVQPAVDQGLCGEFRLAQVLLHQAGTAGPDDAVANLDLKAW